MSAELRACAEALSWALKNLRHLVVLGSTGDAYIRGGGGELVGYAQKFHDAEDALALPAVQASLAGEIVAPSLFDKIGADRLADEVAVLVRRGKLDPRSPAGDALLDYRNPPSSPRADRLAEMEGREPTPDALAQAREIVWRNEQRVEMIQFGSEGIKPYWTKVRRKEYFAFPDVQALVEDIAAALTATRRET